MAVSRCASTPITLPISATGLIPGPATGHFSGLAACNGRLSRLFILSKQMLTTHTTAHAHGLDGRLASPTGLRSPFTSPRRAAPLPQIGRTLRDCHFQSAPFFSSQCDQDGWRAVFLKRHHPSVRDVAGLVKASLFAHLRAHGVDVPECSDGEGIRFEKEIGHMRRTAVHLESTCMAMRCRGRLRSVVHAHSAGAALAGLDCASAGFDAPRRSTTAIVAGSLFCGGRSFSGDFAFFSACGCTS